MPDQQSKTIAKQAPQPMSQFLPPLGLSNPHLQTILSSVGPRRARIRRRFAAHKRQQQAVTLDCGDGVRLLGYLNHASSVNSTPSSKQTPSTLAILIHGWEGGHDSSYMLSMAGNLLANGIDVFRLNLRDHGDTHHLNEGIFNSTLIDEVLGALEDLQRRYQYSDYHLIGFSLGGNFALRAAALACERAVSLSSVIAFCPVIHAANSNIALNSSASWLYGSYFMRKWKKSLRKKLQHFPHYEFGERLDSLKTLDQMNDELVPQYTGFVSLDDYFDAYAINGDRLAKTDCVCYLHFAKDDMIIPVEGVNELADNPDLNVTITEHGGHCGFLQNWRLDSWQDQRVLELICSDQ